MRGEELRVAAATLMAASAELDGLAPRLRAVLADDAWAGPAATRFLDDLVRHATALVRSAEAARQSADRLAARSAALDQTVAVPARAA